MLELELNDKLQLQCKVCVEHFPAVRWVDCLICGSEQLCSQMVDVNLNSLGQKCSDSFCEFLHISNSDEHRKECQEIILESYYCNKCKSYLKFVYDKYCELDKIRNDLKFLRRQCLTDLAVAEFRSSISKTHQMTLLPHGNKITASEQKREGQYKKRKTILQHTQESEVEELERLNKIFESSPIVADSVTEADLISNFDSSETSLDYEKNEDNLTIGETKENKEVFADVDVKEENEDLNEEKELDCYYTTELNDLSSQDFNDITEFSAVSSFDFQDNSSKSENFDSSPSQSGSKTEVSTTVSAPAGKTKRRTTAVTSSSKPKRPRCTDSKSIEKIVQLMNVNVPKAYKILNPDKKSKIRLTFPCTIDGCPKIFRTDYNLQNHKKIAHEGMKYLYECPTCKKRFLRRALFKDHENIHANLTPYDCSSCDLKFATKPRLQIHKRTVHNLSKIHCELTFQCEICKKEFKRQNALKRHQKTIHSNERPYGCDICQKTFQLKNTLESHIAFVHMNKHPLVCEMCKKEFKSEAALKRHQKTVHSNDRPFGCDLCQKTFKRKSTLEGHITIVHVNKHLNAGICELCGQSFKHITSLRHHMQKHATVTDFKSEINSTDDDPLICEICGKQVFKTKRALRNHLFRHKQASKESNKGKTEPIKCETCGKMCKTKDIYKRHELTHLYPDRFKCEYCEFTAPLQCLINAHKEKHNVGKQFQCDLCNGKFKSKLVLKLHKKHFVCVEKPSDLICRFCPKGFKSQRCRTNHERRHRTVEPKYLCCHCGKAFRSNYSLRRHLEQRHQESNGISKVARRNYPSYRRTPLKRFQQTDPQV